MPLLGSAVENVGGASDFNPLSSSASAGLGPLQANANFGLFQIPISASFLNPSATTTFDPTSYFNPTVTQGALSNSLILGPEFGGGQSSSASLFGGGGHGGGGGGNVSNDINYAPQTTFAPTLPNVPGMPAMPNFPSTPNLQLPNPQLMPMPPSQAGMIMPTTQPIAAGGVSPVLASMLSLPQQQQLSQGQPVIPGSASQAGGYDMPAPPPMPMGGANAMGMPNMGGGMMMPRMAPSAAPGNIMTAGGNQIPFNQALAQGATLPGGYPLTPPPAASQPSFAQLGPGYGQSESTPENRGVPMDPEQQEEDALNRAEAATRQGAIAVSDYLNNKEKKRAERELDKRARLEAATKALADAHRKKRELDALKELQNSPDGQRRLMAQADRDAFNAVQQRRAGNQFPVPQVPIPRSYDPYGIHREPFIHLGGQRQRTMPDPITARGLEEQEGQLRNQIYESQLKYYQRNLSDDFKEARADINDAEKELKSLDVEFDKREKRERLEDLDDLRANLNRVRLAQNTAKFEGTTGQRAIQNELGRKNLGQNIRRTDAIVQKTPGQIARTNQLIEKGEDAQYLPKAPVAYKTYRAGLAHLVDTKKITGQRANKLLDMAAAQSFLIGIPK